MLKQVSPAGDHLILQLRVQITYMEGKCHYRVLKKINKNKEVLVVERRAEGPLVRKIGKKTRQIKKKQKQVKYLDKFVKNS